MDHRQTMIGRFAMAGVAVLAAGSLLALSAAPGAAAAPVAQASASAITATIAGQTRDSGSYQSVNDGEKESTSGTRKPAVTVLGGQSLISAGTLAQDATTSVVNGQGRSAACAGLAGSGATVASAGDSGSCLTPGQALTLNPGTLDLSNVQLVSSGLLMGVDGQVAGALQPVVAQLVGPLQTALQTALTQLGLGLNLSLAAVQSNCVSGPNSASGSARLAGAGASVTVGGQQINLVNLPVDPAPNTHVVTNLGDVTNAIETGVRTSLATALSSQSGPVGQLLTGLNLPAVLTQADQTAILDNALNQIGNQLAPLQTNIIDATLNLQSQASPDQITVTALDLKLLPAAQQFGINAFELQVGTSKCGPSGRVAVEAASASPVAQAKPTKKAKPRSTAVPTAVPAGAVTATGPAGEGSGDWGILALGGLLAIGVGAAGAAWSAARSPR